MTRSEASDEERSRTQAGGTFVGRERELAELRAGVEDALAGRGHLFLIVGEAGIGKTRLAEEAAVYASGRGARSLWGRCWEGEAAPPFWPWVQVIRALVRGRPAEALADEIASGGAYLAQMVPEVRALLPGLPAEPAPPADFGQARFDLFEAVAAFLRRATAAAPLLLVLDDLQWADQPSLHLLRFLARDLGGVPIVVLGAYRDVEARLAPAIGETLTLIAREARHIQLRGLNEGEVRRLIERAAAPSAAGSFAATIHQTTQGNPFFVDEIVRLLAAEGRLERPATGASRFALPEGVRSTIRRRLGLVSAQCREALVAAAALGRDFDLAPVAEVCAVSVQRLLALLHEATTAGMVGESAGALGRFRFTHDLLRETLYDDLPYRRRLELHQKIAVTLERIYAQDPEPHLAELAHHFVQSALLGEVDKAVDYAARAGDRADRQLAWEEAAGNYERALQALELRKPADSSLRCDLLLRLGEVLWKAGDFDRSRQVYRRAAEGAARPEQLAEAVIGAGGRDATFEAGAFDAAYADLLERALERLPAGDSVLRARVMARLAAALAFSPAAERRCEVAGAAVEVARRVGDRATLAYVLNTSHWATWGPDGLEERVAATEEIIALTGDFAESALAVTAHMARLAHFLERADPEGAAREFDHLDRQALSLRQPSVRWVAAMTRPMRAFLEGRLEEVEELARQALVIGQEGRNRAALQVYGTQIATLRFEQGRIEEVAESVRAFADRYPALPAWRCGLTWMHAALGREVETRRELERITAGDFSDLPRDLYWLWSLAQLAEVVDFLGDARRAEVLYELLLPYAGRCAAVGGVVCSGSVSRPLGLLASVLGRLDEAAAHFERAIEVNERMRARPLAAHARFDYARMLRERGRGGDRERAVALLEEAVASARALGMTRLLDRVSEARAGAAGARPAGSSLEAVTAAAERREKDLGAHAAADGTVTLVFSDMEGFSEMTERLGDRKAHGVIRVHNAIVREQVAAHGGHEVELQGDGFLLAFPSATGALRCAICIQRALAARSAEHPEQPIRVRIGLHTGEPIAEADRFFGRTVIYAARVAAQARGGEILVSSLVKELTEARGEFVFEAAREVTLKGLAGSHRVYGARWQPENRSPAPLADAVTTSATNVFRREGDYWTITYGGESLRLKDAKGLRYLAHLLRHPGQDLHVADLGRDLAPAPGAGIPKAAEVTTSASLGSAGDILDRRAHAEYRARLSELRAELEQASEWHDQGRADRVRKEIDFLVRELSSAYGLGGRPRKSADSTERVRKAVCGRIRESLGRIAKDHPGLGRHLENALRLGTFCSYTPEKKLRWEL